MTTSEILIVIHGLPVQRLDTNKYFHMYFGGYVIKSEQVIPSLVMTSINYGHVNTKK